MADSMEVVSGVLGKSIRRVPPLFCPTAPCSSFFMEMSAGAASSHQLGNVTHMLYDRGSRPPTPLDRRHASLLRLLQEFS